MAESMKRILLLFTQFISNAGGLTDAVGHTDASLDVSRQDKSRITGLQGINHLEACLATLFVLRDGLLMTMDFNQIGLGIFRELEHRMDVLQNHVLELFITP